MADWNELTTSPIARCQGLSQKRIKGANARLKEHGRDTLREVFRRIDASRFCHGENDKAWVATFEWVVCQPDVPIRVLEGKYDNRTPTAPQRPQLPGQVRAKPGKYDHVERRATGGATSNA